MSKAVPDNDTLFKATQAHVAPLVEIEANALWEGAALRSVVDQAGV
jgi:hypothetical protein